MKQLEQLFKQKFNNSEIQYRSISVADNKAHAFFVKTTNLDLIANWEEISNFIALYFQNDLTSEFERWNIYLFFLTEKGMNVDLKYKIENDTFSSRKILIEGRTDIDEIVKEYILANNIIPESGKRMEINFQPDPLVWETLKGKELKKQRRNGEALPAFDELIAQIKKQRNDEIQ